MTNVYYFFKSQLEIQVTVWLMFSLLIAKYSIELAIFDRDFDLLYTKLNFLSIQESFLIW